MEDNQLVYDMGDFQYVFTSYDQIYVDVVVEGLMRSNAHHIMCREPDRTNVVSREVKDDLIKNNMER